MISTKLHSIHTALALLLDGATTEQAAVIRSALVNLEAIGEQAEALEQRLVPTTDIARPLQEVR